MKSAFTLAEILIALTVIGITAALTIPGIVKNHNERSWTTAQSVFIKRLEVATKQMNTEEKLSGYLTTKNFVNELKKYIKITRICDSNEIAKCFPKEVIWNEGEEPIDISTIKSAANIGQDDWDTETIGVEFANGVNAIIAYNPNAKQDPYNNQFSATSSSIAILYDVSGRKKPNTKGKDIGMINVTKLGGVQSCMITPSLVDNVCITQILSPKGGYNPMSKSECEQAVSDGRLGIKSCYHDTDYWAGAVRACGGIDKMPSQNQLTDLAKYMYNSDKITGVGTAGNLTLDTDKAAQFLANSPLNASDQFIIWTGEEYSQNYAYHRGFNLTYTTPHFRDRNVDFDLAICIDN